MKEEKEKQRGEGREASSIKSNTLSTEIPKSKSNICTKGTHTRPLMVQKTGAICADPLHR